MKNCHIQCHLAAANTNVDAAAKDKNVYHSNALLFDRSQHLARYAAAKGKGIYQILMTLAAVHV